MKKVLAIAFIAASLVACNNSSDKKADGADSTKMADSAKAAMDTAKAAVDTAKAAMDTAKAAVDTAKAK